MLPIYRYLTIIILLNGSINCTLFSQSLIPEVKDPLTGDAIVTMQKAAHYFRNNVATNGGYLFAYKSDFSMRQGEEIATPTMIWRR